jgi:hypothetical protein
VVLTLGVTLLRLVGEVRRWNPEYWSRLPGGGLSLLGISWLAPVVGFYLGWKLQRAGRRPDSLGRAAGWPLGAVALGWYLAALVIKATKSGWDGHFVIWAAVGVGIAAIAFLAWPALGRGLLAYSFAARVPVALVMGLAIWKGLGTHYDVPPPGFPAMPQLKRWLWIGLLPQMTVWIAWTMATGALGGALGWWAASRLSR